MSEIAELFRSDSYSRRVAAEVRSHAARQGIPQKDLATALGYVPSQISKRMRGTIAFTLDELAALADLFGIEPAELMPRRPETPTASSETELAAVVRRQGLEPRTRWFSPDPEPQSWATILHMHPHRIGRPADTDSPIRPRPYRESSPNPLHRVVSA